MNPKTVIKPQRNTPDIIEFEATAENLKATIQQVISVIQACLPDSSPIVTESSEFRKTKNWDSLNHITIILELEKHFQVQFDLNEVANLESIREISKTIIQKKKLKLTVNEPFSGAELKVLFDHRKYETPEKSDVFQLLLDNQSLIPYADGLFTSAGIFQKLVLAADRHLSAFYESIGAEQVRYPSLVDSACRSTNCIHCYINHANSKVNQLIIETNMGSVFRKENLSADHPVRWNEFSVREIVFLGEKSLVLQKVELVKDFYLKLFQNLKLNFYFTEASDTFWTTENQTVELFQKIKKNKFEFRLSIPYLKSDHAAISINLHEDYFTEKYQVKLNKDGSIVSACVGLGLERFVFAVISQYGLNTDLWPFELKSFFYIETK